MNKQRHGFRPLASCSLLLAACALLLFGGAGTASAQLPASTPDLMHHDIFDIGSAGSNITTMAGWTEAHWDGTGVGGDWILRDDPDDDTKGCPGDAGRWTGDGSFYLREDDSDLGGGDGQSILVLRKTIPGFPGGIAAADRTNVRIEFDFYMQDDPESRIGVVWNADAGVSRVADDGYLFYIGDIADDGDDHNDDDYMAEYTLVKRVAGVDEVVANGRIDTYLDPGWGSWTTDSVMEDWCYRLRLDYYCGYVRAQVKQFDCEDGSCEESSWHTIVEWVDDFVTYGHVLRQQRHLPPDAVLRQL